MKSSRPRCAAGFALLFAVAAVHAAIPPTPPAEAKPPAVQVLNHGRFHQFSVYVPAGRPLSFALLLSGDRGWDAAADAVAGQLRSRGTMVAAVDSLRFSAALNADGGQCVFPDGDLENLSHFVQAYFHLPTYLTPNLVGVGSGAALAYAILAQAPKDTFGGAISVDFCPYLGLRKPLCKGSDLRARALPHGGAELLPGAALGDPWIVLQTTTAAACAMPAVRGFVAAVKGAEVLPAAATAISGVAVPGQVAAAFERLSKRSPPERLAPPPAELGDLPVVVVPAAAGKPASDTLAILMSGDGGWAGLDQSVAAALAADGIPVVGLDSLRYFWTARTPDGLAADTDRMIRYYLAALGKQRAMLVGYSQGADVLPFAVNRLPSATRGAVSLVAVMGLSEHALFEFHVASWIADDDSGPATLPEVERIAGIPVVCIYGADESDSLCPKLDPKRVRLVKMSGGHHFDGDYAGLARQIMAAARESDPPRP